MRTTLLTALVIVATAAVVGPAQATEPTATYKSCTAMWARYPNGVTTTSGLGKTYMADKAVEQGFERPAIVSVKTWHRLLSPRLYTDGFSYSKSLLCGRKAPLPQPAPPQTPANVSYTPSTYSTGSQVDVVWQMPSAVSPTPSFILTLNGDNKSLTGVPTTANGVTTFRGIVFGLAASTTYQAWLVATSPAGTSAPTPTATFTTPPPPKSTYTLTYTASCGSGDCGVLLDNASGGSDAHNNVTGGTWSFEIPKTARGIWSIMVFDYSHDGSTGCTITLDGRVVKTASSTGGASAYCSWSNY